MTTRQSIWGMHLVALAWGSSAVIGAMISAPAPLITFARCVFAIIAMLLIFGVAPIKEFFNLSRKLILLIAFSGIMQGLHWILFFQTIKTAGVALALATYATACTQIAIGEVLFLGMSFRAPIFVAALLSAAGIWMLHPVENVYQFLDLGLVYGLASAFAISVMAMIVKYILNQKVGVVVLSVNQSFFAALISLPFALGAGFTLLAPKDLFLTALLGVVCTAMGQTFFNQCVKQIRISSAAVIASMEAPYGVILAVIFLSQALTPQIVLGILLVTSGAVMVSIKRN